MSDIKMAPPDAQVALGIGLIEAARTTVVAALGILPEEPKLVLDNNGQPNTRQCLEEALAWLSQARQTIGQRLMTESGIQIIGD